MRIRASYCLRFFIHQLRKSTVGSGYIFCQCICTVICGMQEKTVETVSDTEFISGYCTDYSRIRFQIVFGGCGRKGDLGFQILYVL